MELGGLDFLRGWGSEKVCIFIFRDTGENQILEVGREVDFFFLELHCLMSLDLEIHEPSSVLIVSILFLLLWKMVERWKNFEFLALAKFPWVFVAIKSHFGIAILLVQIGERFRELHSPRKVVVIEPV